MPDITNKDTEHPLVSFLKNARDFAFVLTVLLYFMGWVYIYYYLEGLHLTLKAIEINFYDFLIYSTNIFIYLYSEHCCGTIIFVLAIMLSSFNKRVGNFVSKRLFTLLLLLFPFVFYLARLAGTHNAKYILEHPTTLQTIKVVFKDLHMEDTANLDSNSKKLMLANIKGRNRILSKNQDGLFRLIVENKTEFSVLQADNEYNSQYPRIFKIPKDKVEFTELTE